MCCEVNSPVTRPPPSTPHGWGTDRSTGAATGSGTGSPASTCSRALYSLFPERSLHTDTNTVRKIYQMIFFSFPLRSRSQRMSFTFLVAQLLVLRPLASLVLVRVRVDRLVDRLRHFLLPALRDDQRKVLVQLLVAVQQLRTDGRRERKREREIN